MKTFLLLGIVLLMVGCSRPPNISKEGCERIPSEMRAQQAAMKRLADLSKPNISQDLAKLKAGIGSLVGSQESLLRQCYAASVDAGPDCAEFDQLGAVQDAKQLLQSAQSLLNKHDAGENTFLIGQFVEKASIELQLESGLKQCF